MNESFGNDIYSVHFMILVANICLFLKYTTKLIEQVSEQLILLKFDIFVVNEDKQKN